MYKYQCIQCLHLNRAHVLRCLMIPFWTYFIKIERIEHFQKFFAHCLEQWISLQYVCLMCVCYLIRIPALLCLDPFIIKYPKCFILLLLLTSFDLWSINQNISSFQLPNVQLSIHWDIFLFLCSVILSRRLLCQSIIPNGSP